MTQAIKQFLEADALRTQGEWRNVYGEEPYADIQIMAGRNKIAKLWLDDAPVHDFNAEQSNNANFIAAASRIAPDIRAMQGAFEQVCGVLSMLNKRQIATWYSNLDGQNSGYYAGWDDAEYAVRQALSLASPFRKTGV